MTVWIKSYTSNVVPFSGLKRSEDRQFLACFRILIQKGHKLSFLKKNHSLILSCIFSSFLHVMIYRQASSLFSGILDQIPVRRSVTFLTFFQFSLIMKKRDNMVVSSTNLKNLLDSIEKSNPIGIPFFSLLFKRLQPAYDIQPVDK